MLIPARTGAGLLMAWLCMTLTGCSGTPPAKPSPVKAETNAVLPVKVTPASQQPMRGVWLATVSGLDWPPRASRQAGDADRVSLQQQAMRETLDQLADLGINTLFFQVKPDGTALYRSDILPWSDVLTGVIGKDPGYDPLAFVLQEAHRRGIKVHAWLNPYRVSTSAHPRTAAALRQTLKTPPASVYALHPDWIRTASDRFVLDPGLPEARQWITRVVTELISRYDVDGIQFDDYFYYETPHSPLQDRSTWQQYGRGFPDKASWRRNNTLLMIRQVSDAINTLKPEIDFGVSPAGVWRNKENDPRGSDTRGGSAYDTAYADTLQWVRLGLLDYIAPQLYWPFARKIVRYDVLTRWWADAVRSTGTRLYIGVALYKVGTASPAEPDWAVEGGVPELKRQLDLNDAEPEVDGSILFREGYLRQTQTRSATEYLRGRWGKGTATPW